MSDTVKKEDFQKHYEEFMNVHSINKDNNKFNDTIFESLKWHYDKIYDPDLTQDDNISRACEYFFFGYDY